MAGDHGRRRNSQKIRALEVKNPPFWRVFRAILVAFILIFMGWLAGSIIVMILGAAYLAFYICATVIKNGDEI